MWTDTVKRGSMLHQVRGLGSLIPSQEFTRQIPAETEAKVVRIRMLPGSQVKAETILLKMSNPRVEQAAVDADLQLMGTFGFTALLLGAIGLYGVMSYSVSQRVRELGVRMALGATASQVIVLVLKEGLRLTLAGVAIGLLGAVAVTRRLSSMLYGVGPTDPLTFAGVSIFLAAVALLANYLPARHAARVDPILALRYE